MYFIICKYTPITLTERKKKHTLYFHANAKPDSPPHRALLAAELEDCVDALPAAEPEPHGASLGGDAGDRPLAVKRLFFFPLLPITHC